MLYALHFFYFYTMKKIYISTFLLVFLLLKNIHAQTVYNNTSPITIQDNAAASLYPSPITVNGISGTVSGIAVTIHNLSHTWVHDVSMILQAPSGESLLLQSGCADGFAASNLTYTFTDQALTQLSSNSIWTNGTYKPTGYFWDIWPSPAPLTPPGVGTYNTPGPFGSFGSNATLASTFNGINPNGQWKLFVADFASGDAGIISGGWSLSLTTSFPLPLLFTNLHTSCIQNQAVLWGAIEDASQISSITIEAGESVEQMHPIQEVKINNSTDFTFNVAYQKQSLINQFVYFRAIATDFNDNKISSDIMIAACEKDETLSIYPNSLSGSIHINNAQGEYLESLNLYNSYGQIVYSQPLAGNTSINLQFESMHLPDGVYYMLLKTNLQTKSFKLIK